MNTSFMQETFADLGIILKLIWISILVHFMPTFLQFRSIGPRAKEDRYYVGYIMFTWGESKKTTKNFDIPLHLHYGFSYFYRFINVQF